jgi:hypothetical protein
MHHLQQSSNSERSAIVMFRWDSQSISGVNLIQPEKQQFPNTNHRQSSTNWERSVLEMFSREMEQTPMQPGKVFSLQFARNS